MWDGVRIWSLENPPPHTHQQHTPHTTQRKSARKGKMIEKENKTTTLGLRSAAKTLGNKMRFNTQY